MTDYIELDATHRLVINQDEDASCPRGDWHMLTGAMSTSDRDRNLIDILPVYEFPGDLHRAWEMARWPSDEGFAVRWARIFHNITVDYNEGTFWWVDPEQMRDNWPDLELGSEEYVAKEREVIEQEQRTYRQWADGGVYGVTLEKAETYVRIADHGAAFDYDKTLTSWEVTDSLWGCYLDDEYSAIDVANEHFDLEGIRDTGWQVCKNGFGPIFVTESEDEAVAVAGLTDPGFTRKGPIGFDGVYIRRILLKQ